MQKAPLSPKTIRLEKIEKCYQGHRVLGPIDLEISAGKQLALLGESGCGKSTLLGILAGSIQPSSGAFWFGEDCVSELSDQRSSEYRLRKVGFVHQFFDLIDELTALENVLIPAWIEGRESARSRADELLTTLGVSELKDRRPALMSGGQKQRIAIARAMLLKPPLIIADEPTGSLDQKTGQDVIERLIEFAKTTEASLIVATHSHQIANLFSEHIYLEDGSIRS